MKYRIPLLFALGALCAALYVQPARAALTDGLVSYWPLNGVTSTNSSATPDITPNGNNLTLFGSTLPTFVAGRVGNAVSLDGVSQYLGLTYNAAGISGWVDNGLPIYNAGFYTICLWVKSASATPAKGTSVLTEGSANSGNPLLQLRTDWQATDSIFSALIEDQNANVFFGNQSFGNVAKSTGAIRPFDGTWHHIAWVDSNGVAALYVDGIQDPTVFINTRVPEPVGTVGGLALNTISIGATLKAAASSYFAGQIQDVAVWERNLSQSEISQVMAGDLPTSIATAAPSFTAQPIGNANLLAGQSWAMQAYGEGTHPRTYQWFSNNVPLVDDGLTIIGSESNILDLIDMPAGYAGSFTVVISNAYGYTPPSQPALVVVSAASPQAPSLTNGQISYWPLDAVNGGVTPDIVGGYDLYLATPMTATNLVAGKFGNAMQFYDAGPLIRICSPGDALPLEKYQSWTVAMWVKEPVPASNPVATGQRFFEMGNTASTAPWVSLANTDTTAQGQADLEHFRGFFRNDNGQNNSTSGVGVSTLPIYDGNWHHVAYVETVVGGALPVLQGSFYVDGVLDPMLTALNPRRPITSQIICIGGTVRNTTSINSGGSRAGMNGTIDDAAVWNRALTAQEISMLTANTVPPGPTNIPPLSITSFQPDFGQVVSGDSSRLTWLFSASATAASINGSDVMSLTTNGQGALTVTGITASTNFTLTVSHGSTILSSNVGVTVVNGVAPGWHILDDFANYPVGPLIATAAINPYWKDLVGGCTIVNPVDPVTGNPTTKNLLNASSGGGNNGQAAILPLGAFTIYSNQTRTVFARLFVTNDPSDGTSQSNAFGVTERAMKSEADFGEDTGPVARFYDDPTPNLAVGAYDNTNGPLNLFPCKLNLGQVYDVWLDVTNGGISTDNLTYTNVNVYFSIWLQREGDAKRIQVLSNYHTDRTGGPDFLGPTLPYLNEFVVGNGGATGTVFLTDAYISTSGYSSTIPVPWTATQLPEPKSSPKRMAAKEAGGGSRGRAPVLGATLKILALTAQMPHK
jgi:hypothetical protein